MLVVLKVMSIMFSTVSGSRSSTTRTVMLSPLMLMVVESVEVVSRAAMAWYAWATVRPAARALSLSMCSSMVASPAPRPVDALAKPSVPSIISMTSSLRAVRVSRSGP